MVKRRHPQLNSAVVAELRQRVQDAGFLNVSRKVGLNYSHLYRALSATGNPCVSTLSILCAAFDLELTVVQKHDALADNTAQLPEQEEHT